MVERSEHSEQTRLSMDLCRLRSVSVQLVRPRCLHSPGPPVTPAPARTLHVSLGE